MAFASPRRKNKSSQEQSKIQKFPVKGGIISTKANPELDLIFPPSRTILDPLRHLELIKAYFQQAGLPVPYNLDGNAEFYTSNNLQKREALRSNKRIIRKIKQFWLCFDTEEDSINCSQYVSVYLKFARAVYGEFDFDKCKKSAFHDWERDCNAAGVSPDDGLHEVGWRYSLFEIADIWTDAISVDSYLAFLDNLFNATTEPYSVTDTPRLPNQNGGLHGFRWRGINACSTILAATRERRPSLNVGELSEPSSSSDEEIKDPNEPKPDIALGGSIFFRSKRGRARNANANFFSDQSLSKQRAQVEDVLRGMWQLEDPETQNWELENKAQWDEMIRALKVAEAANYKASLGAEFDARLLALLAKARPETPKTAPQRKKFVHLSHEERPAALTFHIPEPEVPLIVAPVALDPNPSESERLHEEELQQQQRLEAETRAREEAEALARLAALAKAPVEKEVEEIKIPPKRAAPKFLPSKIMIKAKELEKKSAEPERTVDEGSEKEIWSDTVTTEANTQRSLGPQVVHLHSIVEPPRAEPKAATKLTRLFTPEEDVPVMSFNFDEVAGRVAGEAIKMLKLINTELPDTPRDDSTKNPDPEISPAPLLSLSPGSTQQVVDTPDDAKSEMMLPATRAMQGQTLSLAAPKVYEELVPHARASARETVPDGVFRVSNDGSRLVTPDIPEAGVGVEASEVLLAVPSADDVVKRLAERLQTEADLLESEPEEAAVEEEKAGEGELLETAFPPPDTSRSDATYRADTARSVGSVGSVGSAPESSVGSQQPMSEEGEPSPSPTPRLVAPVAAEKEKVDLADIEVNDNSSELSQLKKAQKKTRRKKPAEVSKSRAVKTRTSDGGKKRSFWRSKTPVAGVIVDAVV
jgi:hypothetical protein